jgi:hypothetical protein
MATMEWDQVVTYYPDNIQILDYYHCEEKLCEFALEAMKDSDERKEWINL